MKSFTQFISPVALISVLGLVGFAQTAHAMSTLAPLVIQRHHHQLIAEVSDGDGETNDDGQTGSHIQSHHSNSSQHSQQGHSANQHSKKHH